MKKPRARARLQREVIRDVVDHAKAAGKSRVTVPLLKLRQETDTRLALEREAHEEAGRRGGRLTGSRGGTPGRRRLIDLQRAAEVAGATGARRDKLATDLAFDAGVDKESVLKVARGLRKPLK